MSYLPPPDPGVSHLPLLAVRDLRMAFPNPEAAVAFAKPLLELPSFQMAPGEQMALIGTSGTGKTTLLHLLAGLLVPQGGEIVYTLPGGGQDRTRKDHAKGIEKGSERCSDMPNGGPTPVRHGTPVSPSNTQGVDITRLSEARRDIFRGTHLGYIFQTHHLLPGFTALENVLLGMAFTRNQADPAWARHLLEEVGLAERLHYLPRKLSTGQQQRVAVARALANRPALVLADEPTGSLDEANAAQVIALIRGLCREAQASLLLVTHDRALAGAFERIVDLKELNQAGKSGGMA